MTAAQFTRLTWLLAGLCLVATIAALVFGFVP